jgi:hypothetical protein
MALLTLEREKGKGKRQKAKGKGKREKAKGRCALGAV